MSKFTAQPPWPIGLITEKRKILPEKLRMKPYPALGLFRRWSHKLPNSFKDALNFYVMFFDLALKLIELMSKFFMRR